MEGYAKSMNERLDMTEPGGIAGKPTLKGEGPAQECYERVQKFKQAQPKATWKEVFENVGNHYANPRSMAGAMRMVEVVREYRKSNK